MQESKAAVMKWASVLEGEGAASRMWKVAAIVAVVVCGLGGGL
jgi:hypothetical protein